MIENQVKTLLSLCRKAKNSSSVSDIHIVQDEVPWIRTDGVLRPFGKLGVTSADEIKQFYEEHLDQTLTADFAKSGYVSTSTHDDNFGDVRIHVVRKLGGVDLVIRLLNPTVPEFEDLGLPAIMKTFADSPNGLYLFTGATGQGKSTALASVVNEINKKFQYSIYTVEDPIEYRHKSNRSLIRQLNVGKEVVNYAEAIRSFLRADPDVILIGEMRDTETMKAALQAAETGHLVFSTLHDNSAVDTVQRVINSFQPEVQEQISTTFQAVVRGIVSMRLVPRASGQGRVPAAEIMLMNEAVRNIIKKGEYNLLRSAIAENRGSGMQTLEDNLNDLIKQGIITRDSAIEASNVPKEIRAA